MKPRILYVVNNPDYFVLHRLPLAIAAMNAGYDVHIASPRGEGVTKLCKAGLRFHPLAMNRRSLAPWRELAALFSFYRVYRRVKPDLVYQVTIKPVLYGGLVARWLGIPAVVSAIPGLGWVLGATGWRATWLRRLVMPFYRWGFAHPNAVGIFENPDDRTHFIDLGILDEEKAVLIKGVGVDLEDFSPQPESVGTIRVLFASRMLWDKGVGDFVSAAQALRSQGISAEFVLAGTSDPGSPDAVPTAQLQTWHESGAVRWLGHVEDMPELIASSHVVCLPSCYREGIPRILIEAAACGRPIVTTDAPGCREIALHEFNGLLVERHNIGDLSNALARLIDDGSLRRRFGEAGRKIAENEFGWENIAEQTLGVYFTLLERAGRTISSEIGLHGSPARLGRN